MPRCGNTAQRQPEVGPLVTGATLHHRGHQQLRNDLILIDEVGFAPLDDTGPQLLFRVVAAAYERRALGIASHWPFESWGPSRGCRR